MSKETFEIEPFKFNGEDLEIVLMKHRKELSYPCLQELLERLDLDRIEIVALKGDNLDEQTSFAYNEATRQLVEKSVISK